MNDNRTNLEYERAECRGVARFLGAFLIPVALLAVLSACATVPADPIERLQQQAWAEPYERRVGDWTAAPEGDCKMRALWLMAELADRDPVAMVGYRDALWPDELHMVVVVDGRVIDRDGVHDLADYLEGWREGPEWYDWRIAHASWLQGEGAGAIVGQEAVVFNGG